MITLAGLMATLGALWLTNGAVTPKEATWDDVLSEAKGGGYRLIATQDLGSAFYQNPNVYLLVDTRQEWEYRTGHIKGAVSFPMEPTWWSRWRKADALKELLGPDQDQKIVFY
jgi:predicted sulfurtransferase